MKIAAVLSYYSKCQHLIQIGIFDRAWHATTQRRSQMIEQHTSVYVLKQQLRPSFIAILLEQGSQLNSNISIYQSRLKSNILYNLVLVNHVQILLSLIKIVQNKHRKISS